MYLYVRVISHDGLSSLSSRPPVLWPTMSLPKPVMRGLLGKRLRFHLPIAFSLSLLAAVAFKVGRQKLCVRSFCNIAWILWIRWMMFIVSSVSIIKLSVVFCWDKLGQLRKQVTSTRCKFPVNYSALLSRSFYWKYFSVHHSKTTNIYCNWTAVVPRNDCDITICSCGITMQINYSNCQYTCTFTLRARQLGSQ